MSEQALHSAILEVLVQRQRRERWGDREMAQRLGISRSYWSLIRTGKKPLSLQVILRAMRAFPEHSVAILSFLAAYVSHSDDIVSYGDTIPMEREPIHVGR